MISQFKLDDLSVIVVGGDPKYHAMDAYDALGKVLGTDHPSLAKLPTVKDITPAFNTPFVMVVKTADIFDL